MGYRSERGRGGRARWLAVAVVLSALFSAASALAIGEATRLDIRGVSYEGGEEEARPSARRRLAWEVRKRTSISTRLNPSRARLDDPTLFETPLLYWSGREAFEPLTDAEVIGLRRFVELGGFVFIDDAAPESGAFGGAIRRALGRAFPTAPLETLGNDHTLFRSFYLLERAEGRVVGPPHLEAISREGRVAVLFSQHDIGGALARDNLGTWLHTVSPGGERQREMAIRLAVNVVMYALCLDYKDDQVHAPFIMRRRGGAP